MSAISDKVYGCSDGVKVLYHWYHITSDQDVCVQQKQSLSLEKTSEIQLYLGGESLGGKRERSSKQCLCNVTEEAKLLLLNVFY